MGRLAWMASAFLLVWLMGRWLRFRQTRRLRAGAEMEPAQAREFAVMTVPATLILDPDGTAVHINNGFTRFDVLARQIDNLLKRHLNEVG